jgi:hypothetical protein
MFLIRSYDEWPIEKDLLTLGRSDSMLFPNFNRAAIIPLKAFTLLKPLGPIHSSSVVYVLNIRDQPKRTTYVK